jgi:hypothetical protein
MPASKASRLRTGPRTIMHLPLALSAISRWFL